LVCAKFDPIQPFGKSFAGGIASKDKPQT
jgi:hypothetical protein